jgi:AraC-like DNA-binding protein
LTQQPRDIAMLSRLIKQEIIYRVLTGKGGEVLYQNVLPRFQQRGINAAIGWIKSHYDQPLNIEKLARLVHMSPSTLHHRFKATTTMSPLQYQKQLRLTQARKILLAGNIEAAAAAFAVGYESPSQFSREYRRCFGAPPLQDIQHYAAMP